MGATTHAQMYDAFGAYVRSQRHLAQLTLRQAAELASISNPYLSQIEHGLALPSISVISSLARALSVSAETMLMRAAGIVAPCTSEGWSQSEDAIRHDPRLDEPQKLALLAVLSSFVGSPGGSSVEPSLTPSERSAKPSAGAGPATSGRTRPQRPRPPKMSDRPATAGAVSARRKRT
ncbi:MAG: helix-turn-helix transcriptional regulator [Dermatophilaceae bacterium]